MSKKAIFILLFLTISGLVLGLLGSHLYRFWLSGLVLTELFDLETGGGWLAYFTPTPWVKEISFPGPVGRVKADLYLHPSGKRQAGILLNHGVIDTGKDDPRLCRLAEILCRSGFTVLVPEFQGMRSFRISPQDVDEIRVSFENLIALQDHVDPQSSGLFAFSYGAGPTILAASQSPIREKVRFVISFGGYYDLKNVLSFLATGVSEFEGKKYYQKPQEYGKWVFLAHHLSFVHSDRDREILGHFIQRKLKGEKVDMEGLHRVLGEEGRTILMLISHSDPAETLSWIRKLPAMMQDWIEALSLSSSMENLRADLILAHGKGDDLIPFTETLRIAQAVPEPEKVYLALLESFSHVDPELRHLSLQTLFQFYIPEGWRLLGLTSRLLRYRAG